LAIGRENGQFSLPARSVTVLSTVPLANNATQVSLDSQKQAIGRAVVIYVRVVTIQ
jgi:hypothetical protein